MKLSQKILEYRKQQNLSQEALSGKLNVSRQSVSKWESDQATPDLDKLILLSQIFGVTLDEMVSESKKESNDSVIEKIELMEKTKKKDKQRNRFFLVILSALLCLSLYFLNDSINKLNMQVRSLQNRLFQMSSDYDLRMRSLQRQIENEDMETLGILENYTSTLSAFDLETQKATYTLRFLLTDEKNLKSITFTAIGNDKDDFTKDETVIGQAYPIGNGYYETVLILDMMMPSYDVSARFEYTDQVKNQSFGFFCGYLLMNPQFSVSLMETSSDATTYRVGPQLLFSGDGLGIFEGKYILDGIFRFQISDSVSNEILYDYPFRLDEVSVFTEDNSDIVSPDFSLSLSVNEKKVSFTKASKLHFTVQYTSNEGEVRIFEIGTLGLDSNGLYRYIGNVH